MLKSPPQGEVSLKDIRHRLGVITTMFDAIEAGELLAALPDCPLARGNHSAAMGMLAIVEAEIASICALLDEAV